MHEQQQLRRVTWGELKKKIDEQVKDDDVINHIVLVQDTITNVALDDIEVLNDEKNRGKTIQNMLKSNAENNRKRR